MAKRFSSGFTLIELVMVIVILGILSAVALPRFFNRQTFEAIGFHDQTLAAVRYGHKAAIAQHQFVFVNVTPGVICLTYAADAGCSDATPANHVLNPANRQWFRLEAPAGITLSSTAASFSFSRLGSPSSGRTIIGVTGDGMTRNITVEEETGYVH